MQRKSYSYAAILPLILFLFSAGCRSSHCDSDAYRQAIAAIHANRASCMLVSGDRILGQYSGRGLNPLLSLYDRHEKDFAGCMIVDKVIGRAAAFIAVRGKAVRVYGRVMSQPAKELLEQYHIATEWGILVPHILNRSRDDICPLEKSVQGITDPEEALPAIRRCSAEQSLLDTGRQ